MFQPERNAKDRKTMRKVCGSIQRIDVPAIFAIDVVTRSLFAINTGAGKTRMQSLDDQFFRSTIGYSHQIDVRLVLGGDTAVIMCPDEGSSLARNRCCRSGKFQCDTRGKLIHFCSPFKALSLSSPDLRA